MKISCRVRGDWFQVPCFDGKKNELISWYIWNHNFSDFLGGTYCNFNPTIIGNKTIRWLGDEALSRYLKLKPPSYVPNKEEVINDIRKTVGGAILDPEDLIKDVLDDNDFISIGNIIVYGTWNRFDGIILVISQ